MAENGNTKCGALVEALAALIEGGEYRPHQKFFSVTRLMRSYQVSQGTVTEALKRLELSGLIYTRPGSGTFVSPPQKVSRILVVSEVSRIESGELNSFLHHLERRLAEKHRCEVTFVPEPEFFANLDDLGIVYRNTVGAIFFRTPKAFAAGRDSLEQNGAAPLFYGSSRHRGELDDERAYYYDEKAIVNGVLDYLHLRGHRKIGCVSHDGAIFDFRRQLYFEWMAGRNLPVAAANVIRGDRSRSLYERILALKRENFDCTALFAIHYRQAIEAVQALGHIGIKVPGDISVITIGHSRDIDFFHPRLTSLVIDHDHDAEAIADRLSAAIRQRTPVPGSQSRFTVTEGESVIPLTIKTTAKGTLP